jgi:hypothetical protein
MTSRTFEHYELVFDLWPDFGNDGGIFHRTPDSGKCYRTTLSYIGGYSMGGVWGEGGFPGRDLRPFHFLNAENSISVVGPSQNRHAWDSLTSKRYSPAFGCDPTGCKPEDWIRLWDSDGWNQFKMQFYGALDGSPSLKAKTWFRKAGAETWIPLMEDTTLVGTIPAGHIGLQVQGGGRFSGSKGTWYRNLKWKPLDAQGTPVIPSRAVQPGRPDRSLAAVIRVEAGQSRVSFDFSTPMAGRTLTLHGIDGRLEEKLDAAEAQVIWSPRRSTRELFLARIEGLGRQESFLFLLH